MLNLIDNLVILAAFIGIVAVAIHFAKSSQDMDDYYRAGRALPWSLVVGTLMASFYGGNGVIGTVGYSTTMGLAGFFIWSIGCHASRFPLALWIAPRVSVRARGTMPELLRRHYGKFTAILGAVVLVITCMSISEVGATGYAGEAAWGLPAVVVSIVVVLISIGITCLGGLMGVAVTDMIFFVLMLCGVCVAFPGMYNAVGGMAGMKETMSQAPELFTATGGLPTLKAVVLILLCINLYKDPAFYQRFAAANSPKTGKRAMLTCFSIFMSFDVICIISGLIVRSHDFGLTIQPELHYVQLVLQNLPTGVRGFYIVGILGAIISTIDTYYLVGGEIISNDIIFMLRGDKALPGKTSILITRLSCVAFGAIGLATAFQFDFIYEITLLLGSMSMSVLFVPLMMAILYEGKKTNVAGTAAAVVGAVVWLWFRFNPVTMENLGAVDPVLIALPASFFAFIIGNFFGRDYSAERRSAIDAAVKSGKDPISVATTDFERQMISYEVYEAKQGKSSFKVEWFGVDGALVLLYVALACIYGYGMLNCVEWIVAYMAPLVASGMAVGIFIKYCSEILSFATGKKSLHGDQKK